MGPDEKRYAECNVMIALETWRRKGIASKALLVAAEFCARYFFVERIVAKVSLKNTASIALFEKLNFKSTDESTVFGERTYETTHKLLQAQISALEVSFESQLLNKAPLESAVLVGMCNPLLDITANVETDFLAQFRLERNDAILADETHSTLFDAMKQRYAPLLFSAGGAGQNTVRAAQHLLPAHSTAYIGCIGNDAHGAQICTAATADGLQLLYQISNDHPTGTCAVLITDRARSLVTRLGAANHLSLDHLKRNDVQTAVNHAAVFYVTSYVMTVNDELPLVLAMHAHSHAKTFCLNLSAPFLCKFFTASLLKCMPFVDVLFGTAEELLDLSSAHKMAHSSIHEAALFWAHFHKANAERPRTLVITQGPEPVIVCFEGSIICVPVPPIDACRIIDTNGGGDVFVGGFLAAYIAGCPLLECVSRGNELAGKIIQISGISFDSLK